MKFNNWYDYFIIFIIIIRIIYYSTYIIYILLQVHDKENISIFKFINNLKNALNIVFSTSMAILLIYLFNPFFKTYEIDNIVKLLLFLYAITLLLSAGWNTFINEKNVIEYIKKLRN